MLAGSALVRSEPIPDYALKYAPYTHLYSGESWWPSDISTHLQNTIPEANSTVLGPAGSATVKNLDTYPSNDVYLTSKDNVFDNPAWLLSTDNKPDSNGYSKAPATLIAVDKGNGTVDVFYFYFYSYNHGNDFLNKTYGNHVGDWEHTMVRYFNGTPAYIYLSAHDGGRAYNYSALEQTDGRATTYVAVGTHANYATAGQQDYDLPFGLLHDTTDKGPFWDVTQNYRGFWFDNSTQTFSSAGGKSTGGEEQASEGADWLKWLGYWGDEQYPDTDPRQYCILDIECAFVSGPTGPIAKNLGRTAVCQKEDDCKIEDSL
ncbi:hypothetical protein VTN96DRAFT_798 [Rasamsonia emersonii]